ncbi:hypothetical protein DPMN_165518 [Dreissena polymorpha]|uniref:Uncharacterized protein n=1 Tax=Dreissena polymorpha TaxID=45954 RepID=A0A9D4EXC5_DREPO|nr:hypothetical protein DPMN_165518 [Dreissena polymorpha]
MKSGLGDYQSVCITPAASTLVEMALHVLNETMDIIAHVDYSGQAQTVKSIYNPQWYPDALQIVLYMYQIKQAFRPGMNQPFTILEAITSW